MRVLIVEDDEMLANTLRWIAEELGDEACVCHTGSEAIDAAHATRPDLVLVDMDLPDMDGAEVCRHVRADVDTQGSTVVAHTAFADSEVRLKAKSAGCHDFFVKGADFPNLMALFDRMHARLAVP